jgi:hypothetical protein
LAKEGMAGTEIRRKILELQFERKRPMGQTRTGWFNPVLARERAEGKNLREEIIGGGGGDWPIKNRNEAVRKLFSCSSLSAFEHKPGVYSMLHP